MPGDDGLTDDGAADDDPPRVLVDVMCGTLATYLRMCGYDAAYALDREIEADDRILSLAATENRTLITRDRELAGRAGDAGLGAVLLTARDVLDQLREVDAAGLAVALADEPTRCGRCNGRVERVAVGDGDGVSPVDRPEYVPDDVGSARRGWRCADCGQWFWKGGHWDDVTARLDDL